MSLSILRNLPSPSTVGKAAGTMATVGALAWGLLIAPWENGPSLKPVLKPYLDSGKIATACTGATGALIDKAYKQNYVFTEAECAAIDHANRVIHTDSVFRLVTFRPVPDLTMAAFVSFHYNVGARCFRLVPRCLKRQMRAIYVVPVKQLPRWVNVKGVKVKGLEKRRFLGDTERVSERTVLLDRS